MKQAAVLQAAVRMGVKRSLYRKQREAAVLLQSTVRCMQQRNRFLQVNISHPWHTTMSLQDHPLPFPG